MHELGILGVSLDTGDGADLGLAHEDGVALHVAAAVGGADDQRVEDLLRVVLGNRATDDLHGGAVALHDDLHVGGRGLVTRGHELLGEGELAVGAQVAVGVAHGARDALNLHGEHLHGGAVLHVDLSHRVEDARTLARALAVVLLEVDDAAVLAQEEAVDAVVLGVLAAVVVHAAASNDVHVGTLADEEVVVHLVGEAALGEHHGDVELLALRARGDVDVDARQVLLRRDDDVLGVLARRKVAVLANVDGTRGLAGLHVGDNLKHVGGDGVNLARIKGARLGGRGHVLLFAHL